MLALIPARGGSKGLPGKNLLQAGGRPLIAWTIEAARASASVDRVVLSSDDEEIMDSARAWGCDVPFRRPRELATDEAATIDVVLHALHALPPHEYVALLQPTSPLRTAADIDAAFALLRELEAPSCVSVCLAEQSPYWMYRLREGNRLEALMPEGGSTVRRQDLPKVYSLNGAIYIARRDWLLSKRTFVGDETVAYEMPAERSLDIDTREDFELFRMKVDGLS